MLRTPDRTVAVENHSNFNWLWRWTRHQWKPGNLFLIQSLAGYRALASRISNRQEGTMRSKVKASIYIQSAHSCYLFVSDGGAARSTDPIRRTRLSDHEGRIPRVVHALQSRFVSQAIHTARYAETPHSAPARLIVTPAPTSVLSGRWPRYDAPTRSAPPTHPTLRSGCPGPASAR